MAHMQILSRLLITGSAALLVITCGCGGGGGHDGGTPPSGAPGLVASPRALDFGGVAVGSQQSQHVLIQNQGNADRTVTQIALTAGGAAAFALAGTPPLPTTLHGGGSLGFDVIAQPAAAQAYKGSVAVSSNEQAMLLVPLAVTGVATAVTEFQVNNSVNLDQRRAFVAALPLADPASGAVAVAFFWDASSLGDASEGPHVHYSSQAVDPSGNRVGPAEDSRIAHHEETDGGVGYTGIAADSVSRHYYAAVRYHSDWPQEPHPRAIFHVSIEGNAVDGGQATTLTAWPPDSIPDAQSIRTLDIAISPSGNRHFCIWQTIGSAVTTNALPEGLDARIVDRNGNFLSSIFQLSSLPSTAQVEPRVQFDGQHFIAVFSQNGTIMGRLFSDSDQGTALGPDFAISTSGGAVHPRVAANTVANVSLVVWEQNGAAMGRLISPDGTVSPIATLGGVGPKEAPAAACDPGSGNWLLAWDVPNQGGVFAQKLGPQLAPLAAPFQVNAISSGPLNEVDVAFSTVISKWIVVWTGLDSSGMGVKGRWVQ